MFFLNKPTINTDPGGYADFYL